MRGSRIVDRDMLRLIKMWLKVPVEERDENGKPRVSGGKGNAPTSSLRPSFSHTENQTHGYG